MQLATTHLSTFIAAIISPGLWTNISNANNILLVIFSVLHALVVYENCCLCSTRLSLLKPSVYASAPLQCQFSSLLPSSSPTSRTQFGLDVLVTNGCSSNSLGPQSRELELWTRNITISNDDGSIGPRQTHTWRPSIQYTQLQMYSQIHFIGGVWLCARKA